MLDDFRNINPPYEIAPSFDEYYEKSTGISLRQ